MTERIKREQSSLSELVQRAIIQMITTEEFKENKLPSEKKLADRFGVSVAVVREALLLLSEEGIVSKKQGAGNFFHPSVLKGRTKLYKYQEFRKLLQQEGYRPEERMTIAEEIHPDDVVRSALELQEEDYVFHFTRQFLVDGKTAILCDNYIPMKLFKTKLELVDVSGSEFHLFDLFRDNMNVESAYGQMQLYPYLSNEEDQKTLGIEPGRPMILMNEEHYSYEDIPLSFSKILLNDEYISINTIGR